MRTVIIGNSGSGKTWLAKRIAARQDRIIHLDDIFWQPGAFEEKRDPQEIRQLILKSKAHPSWIVEGVYSNLVKDYLEVATHLIWIDPPIALCLARLETRGSTNNKHLGRIQSEENRRQLIQWAAQYHDRNDSMSYSAHHTLFASFHGHKVHLKSEAAVTEFSDNHTAVQ